MATTYGTAGGSLQNLRYKRGRVAAGTLGERATAALLAELPAPIVVLHDLVPPDGYGNVDHAAVAGHKIVLIDSKQWAAGTYRRIAGVLWHGPIPRKGRIDLDRAERVRQQFERKHHCTAIYVIAVHGKVRIGYGFRRHRKKIVVCRAQHLNKITYRALGRQQAPEPRFVRSLRRRLAN